MTVIRPAPQIPNRSLEVQLQIRKVGGVKAQAHVPNGTIGSSNLESPNIVAIGMVVESGAEKERAVAVGGRRNLVTTLNVGSFIEMKVIKIRRITEDVTTREKIPGEIETEIVLRVAKNPVDLWLIIEYFNFILVYNVQYLYTIYKKINDKIGIMF